MMKMTDLGEKKHLLIKGAMVLFLVVYIGILCGSDHARNVSMDKIQKGMDAAETVSVLPEQDRKALRRFYQLDAQDMDGCFFRKAASPMSVDEILIVKVKKRAQRDAVLAAVSGHLESQKNIFEGYGTDQMALLNAAIVEARGNYVYYMCGNDAAMWKQALLSIL